MTKKNPNKTKQNKQQTTTNKNTNHLKTQTNKTKHSGTQVKHLLCSSQGIHSHIILSPHVWNRRELSDSNKPGLTAILKGQMQAPGPGLGEQTASLSSALYYPEHSSQGGETAFPLNKIFRKFGSCFLLFGWFVFWVFFVGGFWVGFWCCFFFPLRTYSISVQICLKAEVQLFMLKPNPPLYRLFHESFHPSGRAGRGIFSAAAPHESAGSHIAHILPPGLLGHGIHNTASF